MQKVQKVQKVRKSRKKTPSQFPSMKGNCSGLHVQYECKARAIAPTPKLPNASCLMSVQNLSPTPSFPCKPPPLRHSRVEPSPPLRHSRAGGNLCLGLKAALDSRLRGNDGNKRQFSRVGDLSPTRMLEAAQQVTPLYPSPCKQRQHKPRINHHQ